MLTRAAGGKRGNKRPCKGRLLVVLLPFPLEPVQVVLDLVQELLADRLVAAGADADRHFADVVAGLLDVDGHVLTLRRLGRHLAVNLGAGAGDLLELHLLYGFPGGAGRLVRPSVDHRRVVAQGVRRAWRTGLATAEGHEKKAETEN